MKTPRTLVKIISLALVLCMLFTLVSCDMLSGLFGGSLELVSITVDRSTIKTGYYLGEEIDFSGIKVTVKYSDDSLNTEYTIENLKITYDPDITATEGQKTVTVSFMDPHLGVEQSTTVIITVTEDPNAIKHASYVVDATGMKTTYLIGDTIDFTGVKVIEKFTNGGADVEMTDLSTISYEYDQNITATPGIKSILVKYNGEDAGAISVTVNRPAINEAILDTTGVTLEYLVGASVSFDGLKAHITYENGQTATITEFTFKTDLATLTAEVGEKTVIVEMVDELSGTTREASFKIKVDGIVDYTLDSSDMTLTYLEGETVSFAGIKVTAVYLYGKTEAVSFDDLTFVHAADLTATVGNKPVTVKVGDVEVGSFIVAVGDIPTATANTAGVKTSYLVGQTVTLEGLTVTLKFTDGTADQTLTLDQLTVETDLSGLTATAGTKTVTVKYLFDEYYLYASFDIAVYGITSYEVEGAIKGEYVAGNTYTIDYSDVKVYAVYGDGTKVLVDASKLSFDDAGKTATAGEKQISVYVDGKNANVTVTLTVSRNVVKSIEIGGNFDNKYKLNETTDFSGIVVTITYAGGQVVTVTDLSKLTIANADTSAVTTPANTVTVSLLDEINGETVSAHFQMVVTDNRVVSTFIQSEGLTAFNTDNNNAGKPLVDKNGNTNDSFNSEFYKGNQTYVIGDDNAFKYVPILEFDDGSYPTSYFTDVEITAEGTKLTKKAVKNSVTDYEYYRGEQLIVTVDTFGGKYQFYTTLDSVEISVIPSADYYDVPADINPVKLSAKVIDAYNVYEAWELALFDNNNSQWDTFKKSKGIYGVNVNGLVLHTDISVTADAVPETFFTTLDKEVTYVNALDGSVAYVKPAGSKYLLDVTMIYSRLAIEQDFVIEGNFFNIDTKNFPFVASNNISVTGPDPLLLPADVTVNVGHYTYKDDYSNSVLFRFKGVPGKYIPDRFAPAVTPTLSVNNVSFIGNAARDNIVVQGYDKDLASAGGLLLFRSETYGEICVDNSTLNSFFIPYLADFGGIFTVTNSKCIDSYQNAAFATRNSKLTITDSYFSGTGGPVIITQSELVDKFDYNGVTYTDERFSPTTIITNTVLDTHLNGDELWFDALGVTALAGQIKALGNLAPLGRWTDGQSKMNIKGILMGSGTAAALKDCDIEGTLIIDGINFSRWATDEHWNTIRNYRIPVLDDNGNPMIVGGQLVTVNALENNVPFLTVYYGGQAYTFWTDGKGNLYDLSGNQFSLTTVGTAEAPGIHMMHYLAFTNATDIVLTQGGLSVVLEFYH